MRTRFAMTAGAIAALALPMGFARPAGAATTTNIGFSGTIANGLTVNDGITPGSIAAGSPYTGSFTYDAAQTAAYVAFGGGTRTVYTFTSLSFTIGGSTATSGPGVIDVFDNLTTTVGYPSGDSVYVNFTNGTTGTGVAPGSTLAGLDFNWMGLAFLDPTGSAITNGALPTSFSAAAFPTMFSEFNFGTLGQPWGAGNTSTVETLTTGPAPVTFAPSLPGGTVGALYSASFPAATGGTGSFNYTASGLPAGLSLSGTTVSGTPTTAGTSNVTLTATDSSGASTSATLAVTISPRSSGYTVPDEGHGRITAVGAGDTSLSVGGRTIVWTSSTQVTVGTGKHRIHVINGTVVPGMSIKWQGLRNPVTNTVLASEITIK